MGAEVLLWPVGIALLVLRALIGSNKFLAKFSKGKLDWIKFVQFGLLLFGVWTLFTAPLPMFAAGWQSIAEIVGSLFSLFGEWVASWFGAGAAASQVIFSIIFGVLLAAAVLDLLDLDPERRAKTLVWLAPPLAIASVGWIAAAFTSAVQWAALVGPMAMINAVT